MSKITETVRALAEPVVAGLGLELWDVEYVKESGTYFLRIFIDKKGGVDISDCEAVSRKLDPLLDSADPIPTSYTFEVSSAGAERELKRPSDFEKFLGSMVEIRHYQNVEGLKSHVGKLISFENGDVTIESNGKTVKYPKAQIAQTKLRVTI